ncbi:MAG: hypothetical protein V4687_03515 [Bacteroidota bacterium]
MSLLRFTLYYLLFTLLLGGVILALESGFSDLQILADKFWIIFGFIAGITFIAYILADFGMKKNPEMGVMAIMGSIAVKMLFSMAFVLIYSIKSEQKGLVFVLDFFSLYLLFSFFEIYCLLRNLRHQNK